MAAHTGAAPEETVDPRPVEEVLRAFAAALRSYKLYAGTNPMVERFLQTFREKLDAVWKDESSLPIQIEEDRMLWEGHQVFPSPETGPELAFLFYKDGVREVTILPGFEDGEVVSVLQVLANAPNLKRDEDDLVTLLWEQDLSYFRYKVVEAGEEPGEALHEASADEEKPNVDVQAVQSYQPSRPGISTDEFNETLYFLSDAELRQLREEIERENARDLWRDVLNALLDRLEDGDEQRQRRIITILGELLPSSLAAAQFERAAGLLEEIVALAGTPGTLTAGSLRDVRELFQHLGTDQTIFQLADILEELPHRLSEDAVLRLLSLFPPGSIGALLRATERVEQSSVRRAFETCIQRLAESNRGEILSLLESDDPHVVAGALKWVARLEIGSALQSVIGFLNHSDPEIRIAAVEAIASIRAATAGNSIIPLLRDSARDVRISAARALAVLSFPGARAPLEGILTSREIRDADRLEKLAFFESYGSLAGQEGVGVLDKILNAKGWFNRGEDADTRACAAVALARIRHPSARAALEKASTDGDAVVRAAVGRALRDSGQ